MELSKQLKAAILADFAYQYNKRWNEDWEVDLCHTCNIVNIYRKGGSANCDGHFLGKLTDFCREWFGSAPCAGLFIDGFEFYI